MATRIRLQRQGKKGRPYYHIVVADQRSPRDGRYIERIGAYDPNQNPAMVEIDHDRAVGWLQKGAQPSDTCRAILSYRGVLYKNHLLNGVKKGAFDEAEAMRRFDAWLNEKNTKIEGKRKDLDAAASAAMAARTEQETKKAQDMAAALSAKLAAVEAPPAEPSPGDGAAPVADDAPAAEAAPAEDAAPVAEAAPSAEEVPAAEEAPEAASDAEEDTKAE
ncbi:MAG: 30S ribosomal protein S16 [Flavobacteriales bacterium]|nr:30S ribosomal protein S16 [Flavobacteriales bacterium]